MTFSRARLLKAKLKELDVLISVRNLKRTQGVLFLLLFKVSIWFKSHITNMKTEPQNRLKTLIWNSFSKNQWHGFPCFWVLMPDVQHKRVLPPWVHLRLCTVCTRAHECVCYSQQWRWTLVHCTEEMGWNTMAYIYFSAMRPMLDFWPLVLWDNKLKLL